MWGGRRGKPFLERRLVLGPASANWDFERKLLFLALVHDVGKLLSLFGEDDANVDGMNTRVLHGGRSGHERGLECGYGYGYGYGCD